MNPTNEQELREQINAIRERLVGRNQTHQQVARLSKWTRIELENVIKEDSWIYEDEMIALIQAHTNAEIAKVLDRLEIEMPSKRNTLVGDAYQRTFCNEYNKALKEVSKVIQAERAKLKEVK